MFKRQENILKLIVESYIKTARPIGSNALCKKLKCSSATIRNEMSDLENLGFLEKTHISSGRIPSESGYRYYVDNLMKPKEMTGEDVLKLQTIFHNKTLEISDTIAKSLEIISELTNYTSVVLGNASKENKLKQVEIVPLEDNKILAIIITDKGHVEHRNLLIPNISIDEVKQTVDLINKLVVGTPIDEVSIKLEYEIKPIISKYVRQYETLYNAFYSAFNDFSNKNNVYFAGKNNILKQPEFSSVDKIKNILDKFEDKELVTKVEDNGDIKIYIGKENEIDPDVTVIKTSYTANGEEGTIAVVGPKRMEYDRVVSILDYIKKNIGR